MCLKESDMKQQIATQPQRTQRKNGKLWASLTQICRFRRQSNVQNAVCCGESHKMEYLTRTVSQRQKTLNPSFQFSKHNHDTQWSRCRITPLSNKEHQWRINVFPKMEEQGHLLSSLLEFLFCIKDHDQNPHGAERLYFFSQLPGFPSALTLAERLSAMYGVCP